MEHQEFARAKSLHTNQDEEVLNLSPVLMTVQKGKELDLNLTEISHGQDVLEQMLFCYLPSTYSIQSHANIPCTVPAYVLQLLPFQAISDAEEYAHNYCILANLKCVLNWLDGLKVIPPSKRLKRYGLAGFNKTQTSSDNEKATPQS